MNSQTFLDELGIGGLSDEDQALIAEKMTESVLKRITADLLGEMSPDDLTAFEALPEEASSDEIEDFFRSRFTDYDARVERVIDEFKDEIRGAVTGSND